MLIPDGSDLTLTNYVLFLELPNDIDKMKDSDIQVAHKWREHIQKALIHYFDAGYYINSLQVEREGNTRRTYYVLERLSKPYKSMTNY